MTKDEMEKGFAKGRQLTQEEWAAPHEILAVNELLSEGKARLVDGWRYKDGFQCERRIVEGVAKATP